MTRTFACGSCQNQIRRHATALVPSVCPYCRSSAMSELSMAEAALMTMATPQAQRTTPAPAAGDVQPAPDERSTPTAFACERGELCTRLRGGECPGGKGC